MSDEPNNQDKNDEKEESVHLSIASLHDLSLLETETLASEIHLLGQLRDRLSPAARYADKIQTKYRRIHSKTEEEAEQLDYLVEGFPFVERGKPLTGLLVIDKYSTVEIEPGGNELNVRGQYAGERLYLTHDRKWILAERVGAYSGTSGTTSEWEATCRIVTDRSLLERYTIDVITDGLFASTNRLWEKLSPRMEALKKRSEKANTVADKLAQLKSLPKMRFGTEPKQLAKQKIAEETKAAVAAISKIRMIGHS